MGVGEIGKDSTPKLQSQPYYLFFFGFETGSHLAQRGLTQTC